MRAAERGANLGAITSALMRLLDRYGAAELQAAILEALERDVPHPNAVRLALERRREQRGAGAAGRPRAASACADARRAGAAARARNLRPTQGAIAMTDLDTLRARASGAAICMACWRTGPRSPPKPGSPPLLDWEEQERARRSLERRLRSAHIGRFKPLCDFDWNWPKRCDRAAIEALMALDFLDEAANVVLVGPNGVGKSTLAQNIAHQALIHGHTVLFTSAGQLLGDLCALDSDSALRRRLRHYARPQLLVIDEVGYLSYSNRHADLMFELISRRYQNKSTLITTNRAVRRMARGVPQRRLRRLAGRPPRPQRRDHRHRRRILSPQGSP